MRCAQFGVALITTLLLPAPGSSQSAAASCTRTTIDHVPVVVRSLDQARLTYEQLGFRLKAGRLHDNGLRNSFAKLLGGDYLELISPERGAQDALTERYVAQLGHGEGASSLALRADSLTALAGRFEAAGVPVRTQTYGSAFRILSFTDDDLSWLFLIEYLSPVIDPLDMLSHANTATNIETVWLTEQAFATVVRIADELCLPDLRQARQAAGSGPVAGVTLRIRSADAALQTVSDAGRRPPVGTDSMGRGFVVPASEAHGIFIEFRDSDPSPGS